MSGESRNIPDWKRRMSYPVTRNENCAVTTNVRARSVRSSDDGVILTKSRHCVSDEVEVLHGDGEIPVGRGGSEQRASSHT